MNASLGEALRKWVPPAVLDLWRGRFGSFRFQGDFPSWAAAMRQCQGYSSDAILARVKAASQAVEEGRAAFERDSVLFGRIEYSWPVLAGLLWVASQTNGCLNVLDLGGSLGGTFRQNRRFLAHLDTLNWWVVEQPNFVACGKRHFENGVLRFFPDLDSCLRFGRPHVALFSSVLQYLEDPSEVMERVMAAGIDFLIIDRTPFLEGSRDRLCVQAVSGRIYPATYPAWFFSRSRFLGLLQTRYDLVEEFDAADATASVPCRYLGFLLRRRSLAAEGR
jgi:putative methyltransferase (TIGR04325 family)